MIEILGSLVNATDAYIKIADMFSLNSKRIFIHHLGARTLRTMGTTNILSLLSLLCTSSVLSTNYCWPMMPFG